MTEQTDDSASPAEAAEAEAAEAEAAEAEAAEADVAFIAAERLVFFSDAVVAIAITLLAFALPVPHVTSSRNGALLHALAGKLPAYVLFLISFVVIGAHWRSHHRLFRNVARLDGFVTAVDMAWLLMIIITPFTTKLLTGSGGFGVRFGLYAIVQVLTLLALWLMSRRLRDSRLLRPGAAPPLTATEERAVLFAAGMFAVSIPLGFVTGWAFVCWLAAGAVPRWIRLTRDIRRR
jgi:uncharacterized membrane protein